jgi:acetyltransferase-like isoleucine patch superfamily enzyme
MTTHQRIGDSDIFVDSFTYGHELLNILQWNEGATLTIGKYCSIAHPVTIFLGGDHRTDWITTYPFGHIHGSQFGDPMPGHPKTKGNVIIGNDVWIGADSKIMSGVTIGDGAVIAGSAVVVKDVEPYSVVGGNPAKLLKYRFSPDIIAQLRRLAWWNLPPETVKLITRELCTAPTPQLVQSLIERYGETP